MFFISEAINKKTSIRVAKSLGEIQDVNPGVKIASKLANFEEVIFDTDSNSLDMKKRDKLTYMKKPQILLVHGGMTFKNERDYLEHLKAKEVSTEKKPYWELDLEKKFEKKFEIIRPRMPLQDNAKYRDWKILFERYIPLLKKNFILIGSSLGGIFLAKYLSENKLRKKALSVYLVCAPFDGDLPS